jgi:4-hydroxy-tetrahydrodipicolinate reductase
MSDTPVTDVALLGMGRMGRALALLAPERSCRIVAQLDAQDTRDGLTLAQLNGAAVAIEFTEPSAAVDNAIRCLELGCPVVIGTTGWNAELPRLERAVHDSGGLALWSPNFSLGVQLFLALAAEAGRLVRASGGFDAHLVETHHAAKKDAPSGTALGIAQRFEGGSAAELAITSVRTGHVPGTHEVILDAPFEQIRLVHEARDRRVFADGALRAARWLAAVGTPGLYTMQDVIAGTLAREHP